MVSSAQKKLIALLQLGLLAAPSRAMIQPPVPRVPIASVMTGGGKSLELALTKPNPEVMDSTKSASFVRSGQVKHGGQALYDYEMSITEDGYLVTTVNWAGDIKGAKSATLKTKIDDKSTTGDIDGRQLAPTKLASGIDASAIKFADGKPATPLQAPAGISQADVSGLVKTATSSARNFFAVAPADDQPVVPRSANEPLGGMRILPRGVDRSVDPGHFSSTYGSGSCKACKTGVWVAEGVALAGCTAACIFSFGTACAFCYAGAAVAAVSGLEACQHSTNCCPKPCAEGAVPFISPGSCCFTEETCLQGVGNSRGRCCKAGKTPCMGKNCCSFGQKCLTSGVDKGTCCPEGVSVCGGKCCPGDSDVCVSDKCCAKNKTCGNNCCKDIKGDFFTTEYVCANASKGLCCQKGQVEIDGICCDKGQVKCGNKCCTGRCSPQGQCIPDCKQMWGSGSGPCKTFKDCPGSDKGCSSDGCCYDIPR